MPIKLNISDKGKAWRVELADESIHGRSVGEKIEGKDIRAELEGYEFEITGGSDTSGFPLSKDAEGLALKKVLLTKGWGMRDNREGMRMRKTVRGKVISGTTALLNLKVLKHGGKKLEEIFPDQNKAEQSSAVPSAAVATEGKPKEEVKKEAPAVPVA